METNNNNRQDNKILLVYKDFDDNLKIESVWATKIGQYFRIDNIPFFAENLSFGDIIAAEEENGSLYFERLIQPSGHSTIQIILYNIKELEKIGEELVGLGCDWEESNIKGHLSIDIPPDVKYSIIKEYLNKGVGDKKWDYKEACLSNEHRGA